MKQLLLGLMILASAPAWADFYIAGARQCTKETGSLSNFMDWAVQQGHTVTEMSFTCRGCEGKVFVAEEKKSSIRAVMFENKTACRIYVGWRIESARGN